MKIFRYILFVCVVSGGLRAAKPTFGDLAVLLAKGYFGGYVGQEASLKQCVMFLNKQGICFSLFDLMDPDKTVNKEDVARVVGQSMLLFSGESELSNGCIKKPLKAKNWVDYCLLNDIDLRPIWNGIVQRTSGGSLPEVKRFFKR